MMAAMPAPDLDALSAEELRDLVRHQATELAWRQAKIDKLTQELALHKRWRFGARTEQWPAEQRHLFEEAVEAVMKLLEGQKQ